jgi:hypothetical protein
VRAFSLPSVLRLDLAHLYQQAGDRQRAADTYREVIAIQARGSLRRLERPAERRR